MATITIGGKDYTSYASVDEADEYLAPSVTAETWPTLDTETKGKLLITASRILARQTFTDAITPDVLRDATSEYAGALAEDSELVGQSGAEAPVKRLKAEGVEIEYFRRDGGAVGRLPFVVFEMLQPFMAAASVSVGAYVNDVETESVTNKDFTFSEGF